jgi:hypothetical protein
MTTKAEWLALAERCEKATGPDRQIDALIWQILYGKAALKYAHRGHLIEAENGEVPISAVRVTEHDPESVARSFGAPALTASLDFINALIEREFPEAEFNSTSKVQGDGIGGLKRYAYAWLVIGPRHYATNAVASEALGRAATFCRAMAEKAA